MNRIMLDLETMGTGSDAAIIAIGAVKFDEKKITDEFYEIVDLQSSVDAGLKIEAQTVLWWMQQDGEARGQFDGKAISLKKALKKFSEFVLDEQHDEPEIWGNGANFDNVILANAYYFSDISKPWYYWNDRCFRTVKALNPQIKMERTGIYHCALDDAKTQAEHLIRMLGKK
jgi:exodeoxyribonuclease VIII